jgi:hypothetical protein
MNHENVVVFLKMDDPLRPAGILLVSGDPEHLNTEIVTYELLKEVRKLAREQKVFTTEGYYRVIVQVFNKEPIVTYKILGVGHFTEMEFAL